MSKKIPIKKRQEILNYVEKEISDRRTGFISKFTLNKDLEDTFDISATSLSNILKDNLNKDDRDYRLSEIKSQTGKKSKGNPHFYKSMTREERQYNHKISQISEEIIRDQMEDGGFTVVKIETPEFSEDNVFIRNTVQWEEINKLSNGSRIVKDLKYLYNSMTNFKYPDFVSERSDNVIFTEVKTGRSKNKVIKQKRSLNALEKIGYNTEVVTPHKDVLVERLKAAGLPTKI